VNNPVLYLRIAATSFLIMKTELIAVMDLSSICLVNAVPITWSVRLRYLKLFTNSNY
jgi:hypothetical protein